MVIIQFKSIRQFYERYPSAKKPLLAWYEKTLAANWSNITDVQNTFRYADHIGGERVVFNIRGNEYRLIAAVIYQTRTLYIKFIGTHEEYDNVDVHIRVYSE
jgi:mRNA interferase HigB